MPVAANLIRVTRPAEADAVWPTFLAFYSSSALATSAVVEINEDGSLGEEIFSFGVGTLWSYFTRWVTTWVGSDPSGTIAGPAAISPDRIIDMTTGTVVSQSSLLSHCSDVLSPFLWVGDGWVYWHELVDETSPHRSQGASYVRAYLRKARLDGTLAQDVSFVDWPSTEWGGAEEVRHAFVCAGMVSATKIGFYRGVRFYTGGVIGALRILQSQWNHDGSGGEIVGFSPDSSIHMDFNVGVDNFITPSYSEAQGTTTQKLWRFLYGEDREEVWTPTTTQRLLSISKSGDEIEMFEKAFESTSANPAHWIRGTTTAFSERIALPKYLSVNPVGFVRTS